MCAPKILSVLASEMNFTMPSLSSLVRARLLAMKGNLPTYAKQGEIARNQGEPRDQRAIL